MKFDHHMVTYQKNLSWVNCVFFRDPKVFEIWSNFRPYQTPKKNDHQKFDLKILINQDSANETTLDNVDASTMYTIQMQYFTKYNTTGYSNMISFNTSKQLSFLIFSSFSKIKFVFKFHFFCGNEHFWTTFFVFHCTAIEAIINVAIQSTELVESEPGTLTCLTTSSSIVSQIMWQKDDTIIEKYQPGITIDDAERTLSFSNLSHFYDNGKYVCSIRLSTNDQILHSEPFYLMVKCKHCWILYFYLFAYLDFKIKGIYSTSSKSIFFTFKPVDISTKGKNTGLMQSGSMSQKRFFNFWKFFRSIGLEVSFFILNAQPDPTQTTWHFNWHSTYFSFCFIQRWAIFYGLIRSQIAIPVQYQWVRKFPMFSRRPWSIQIWMEVQ